MRIFLFKIALFIIFSGCAFISGSAFAETYYQDEKTALVQAEKGDASAQYFLADYYLHSNEERYASVFPLFNLNVDSKIKKDHLLGLEWLKKAAKNGDSSAMFDLATLYDPDYASSLLGLYAPKDMQDIKKAIYWYDRHRCREISVHLPVG